MISITTIARRAGRPALPAPALTNVTIHAAEAGTAILRSVRDGSDHIDVTAIDRLPAGLDPCVAWLARTFPDLPVLDRGLRVTIDADGLGEALWDRLRVRGRRRWQLYDKRGRDRQELVNGLLVAQSEGRIVIRPSAHGDAMRKALAGYRRTVGEDGVIGGELVVALGLAVVGRRIPPPRVY